MGDDYQDTLDVDGNVVSSGYRDCDDRFGMLEPWLPTAGVVVDVGSNLGYFAGRVARERPDVFVWSIEGHAETADRQASIFAVDWPENLVLSNRPVRLVDLCRWARACEGFDTILALSVLHYFDADEIPEVLDLFGRLAGRVVVEWPRVDETGVANHDVVAAVDFERVLHFLFDSVQHVGTARATTDPDLERDVYVAENYRIERDRLTPYVGGEASRPHLLRYERLRWRLDRRPVDEWIPGVNLYDLLSFGVVWPEPETLIEQAAHAYCDVIERHGAAHDVRPWNVLVGSHGVVPIDYDETTGPSRFDRSSTPVEIAVALAQCAPTS